MKHKDIQQILASYDWEVFDDREIPSLDLVSPLAYQDSLIRWIPQKNQPPTAAMHLYPIETPSILLGARDTRLPNFLEAAHFLENQGYQTLVRPHGGLAVVADKGIANLSLVTNHAITPLCIDLAYQLMVGFIRYLLGKLHLQVESYEVPESYCPGKYDLIVGGLKIGGIAQRRFKSGVTTAAYISVNGNQTLRADLLKEFYYLGKANEDYPDIQAEKMATLQDFLPHILTVDDFNTLAKKFLEERATVQPGNFKDPLLQNIYQQRLLIGHERLQRSFHS